VSDKADNGVSVLHGTIDSLFRTAYSPSEDSMARRKKNKPAKEAAKQPTVKIAVRLDKESVDSLERLETEHGVNFSAAVRLAVKQWLANHPLLHKKK
jgi:hypothetical protein